MSAITTQSAADVASRIARKEVTATEVCRAHLDRIAAIDGALHAFHTVAAERALERARVLDAEQQAGRLAGPLHGVPIAIKDNMSTRGVKTTASVPRVIRGQRTAYRADRAAVRRLPWPRGWRLSRWDLTPADRFASPPP
jgi:aspartyl-tRNA(Asn)/glutamyl-tRNA(Gln) amidotransferase subunit A